MRSRFEGERGLVEGICQGREFSGKLVRLLEVLREELGWDESVGVVGNTGEIGGQAIPVMQIMSGRLVMQILQVM